MPAGQGRGSALKFNSSHAHFLKGAVWRIQQHKKNHKSEAVINESGVNDVSFFSFFLSFLAHSRPLRKEVFGRGAIATGPTAGQGPSGAPHSAIILHTVAIGMFSLPLLPPPKNVLAHERASACGWLFFFFNVCMSGL